MRATVLVLIVLALGLAVAACGGDDGMPEVDATVDTREAADELERRAEEVEGILEDRVRGLTDVRSLDDLSQELRGARSELDQAADDIAETDVPDDQQDEREELERRVRDLSSELENAQERVDEDDLTGAVDELRDLQSVEELEDLVGRIKNE
jgi:predicted  nucleic acid-binding Zn-ribbon protein